MVKVVKKVNDDKYFDTERVLSNDALIFTSKRGKEKKAG
jgi:hypothetical protein